RAGPVAHDRGAFFTTPSAPGAPTPHEPQDLLLQSARLHDRSDILDSFFLATVEAVEEAILNALLAAETMTGRDGLLAPALPEDRLRDLLRQHGRLWIKP
ncbi:MAG: P1 family peptidase, partial [Anaerolineaceae bacterium]|nr:P1 family peptidase [Anaerolineaceae bacterium]